MFCSHRCSLLIFFEINVLNKCYITLFIHFQLLYRGKVLQNEKNRLVFDVTVCRFAYTTADVVNLPLICTSTSCINHALD